ncbi:MAG: DNA mismatch repair endonuclease MutL [bacterium]
MTKIKVMSEHLANKIAAGEVIERTTSVIKELIENSVDAGSTDIKVSLESSGKTKIEIIDNGAGMDNEDAHLCFFSHATSKIKKDDDLFFINTLGFRGEALASIASVSKITLKTCNGKESTFIKLSAGKIIEEGSSDGRIGTSITVTDLFFNTPARLKFLKTESSELSATVNLIEKIALSNPSISFTLVNNEKTILRTSGSGNLHKTIHEIFGMSISNAMLKIEASNDDFYVDGYVSKPEVMKNNRNNFITFVNGRLVRSFEVNKAINDAYHTYKPVDKFPVIVLNIDIDPTMIDVNIHPTKQEIKISKCDELCSLIYKAVKKELAKTLLIPELKEDIQEVKQLIPEENIIKEETIVQQSLNFGEVTIVEEKEEKIVSISSFKMYPVGLVHGTYIIAQNEEGMFLIDQHAAAERINYEKYLNNLRKKEVCKNSLLIPINIEYSKSEFIKIMSKEEEIKNIGIDFSVFGESSIIINSHPDYLKLGYEEESIRKIIDITINSNYDRVKFEEHIAITLACKMSLKGNTSITETEMEYFLNEVVKCENPYTCPHGRPTIIKYSKYELEKLFLRSI